MKIGKLKSWNIRKLLGLLLVFFFVISFVPNFPNHVKAATTDGSFSIQVPNSGNLVQGCSYSADIRVNAGSNTTNAADVIVTFDPTKIEIIDSNLSQSTPTAKQIKPGPAYEVYPANGNRVDEGTGIIRLSGVSLGSTFSGNDIFGTIQFKGKAGATNGSFNIQFTGVGDTLDSNIADYTTSTDVLGSVTNANFTFATGSCIPDTTAPNINFINPVNNQSGVDVNQDITLNLTDNLSGVDINTLHIFVNGVEYTALSPEISITGNPNNYSITLNPNDPFYSNSPSSIVVDVKDFAGNTRQSSISFNFPPQPTPTAPPPIIITPTPTPSSPAPDLVAPEIMFINPVSNQTIGSTDPITFDLIDTGSGINLNNLVIYVNDKKYLSTDSTVIVTGDPSHYKITIRDNFNFSKVSSSYLSVFASDLNGNTVSGNVIFNIPQGVVEENTPPVPCTAVIPDSCVTNTPFNNQIDSIQKSIRDVTPEILQPAVDNAGFLGLASVVALLPLAIQILIALGSLIAGGFLWPLFYALIAPSKNKVGKIIDDYSRYGISFVKITVREKSTNSIVRKAFTDLAGFYAIHLDPGEYIFHLDKKGYTSLEAEAKIDKPQDIPYTFQMSVKDSSDLGTNIQLQVFKFDPILFTSVLATIIASINLLYVRTVVAVIIFIITLIFLGIMVYKSFASRTPLKVPSSSS